MRFVDVRYGARRRALCGALIALALAACGGTEEKTVVVNPPAPAVAAPSGSTVVVPPGGQVRVCPSGVYSC